MYTTEQIESADQALKADPNLAHRIAEDVRRSAAAARSTDTWAEIDAELAVTMGRAKSATGAMQLLILIDAQKRFDNFLADKIAADKRDAAGRRAMADEARFFPMRERARQDWAERVGKPIFAALTALDERIAAARAEIYAAKTDDNIAAALEVAAEAILSAKNSIAIETKALARRKALVASNPETAAGRMAA